MKPPSSVICPPSSDIPRWQRIGQLHDLLEAGGFPRIGALARHLNVYRDVVRSDLAFMRTHLGMPVAFDVRRQGYCYNTLAPSRPTRPLPEDLLFTLLVGYRALMPAISTRREDAARQAIERFANWIGPGESMVIPDLRQVMNDIKRDGTKTTSRILSAQALAAISLTA